MHENVEKTRRDRRRRPGGGRHRGRAGAQRAEQQHRACTSRPARWWPASRRRARPSASAAWSRTARCRRDNLTVHFVVTDLAKDIPVSYTGILPDLFKEGKGAVVQGRLGPDGNFTASEVLAKHDENYMPPRSAGARSTRPRNRKEPPSHDSRTRAFRPDPGAVRGRRAGHAAAARRAPRPARMDGAGAAGRAGALPAGRGFVRLRWPGASTSTISRSPTWPSTRIRCCPRCTGWRRCGAATKARCCCGSSCSSGWTVAVAQLSRTLDEAMVARVLGVLGLVATGLLLFVLFTSNPFERLLPGRRGWPRPESAAAGPGPGLPSADALHGLCRLLGGLRLCHRGAARRAGWTPPGRAGRGPGPRWPGSS